MKIQTSRAIRADATITPGCLRRIVCSLFVVATVVAAVAAVGSQNANQGLPGVGDAAPVNVIVVTNTNDSGPGSLRDALAVANDGDTIDATGVSGTILLTSGVLQITHSVTINGPGAGNLAVDGNATSSVFENFARVTISGFTITNGNGVGIFNHVALTLSESSVVGNAGVGISNSHNSVAGNAITDADRLVTLTITNCTVSGNSGGGISNIGFGSRFGSTIAELTVSNCTISGNSASNGGGIYNAASGLQQVGAARVAMSNSTISGNSATGHGGGIYNNNAGGGAELELGSTILKVGSSGENIFNNGGTVTSLWYNLATDNGGGFLTGPGDQINTDPMLGPLQDNGGPTFTHALLPGSPAIDAGDPNFTPPPLYDQRGPDFWRVRNGRIDIGSFEVQVGSTPTPTPRATPRPRPTPHPRP